MICTMCMHGTTRQWRCLCGETNCHHMMTCPVCRKNRYQMETAEKRSLAVNQPGQIVCVECQGHGFRPDLQYMAHPDDPEPTVPECSDCHGKGLRMPR